MKDVYFVRHGQTVWNVENKICGATDSRLTELGRKQAEETGEIILKSKIQADEILYSPLSRAKDTALIISEITGIPAREEERLIEQNFGKYEGTARDGAEFKVSKTHFVDSYEGGETMLRLAQRIYNLLDEIKADEKTYILVAHNGIARMVNSYFNDMTNEEYAAFGLPNCSVMKYEFVYKKIPCPCCGYKTVEKNYDICPVCFWENDKTQTKDIDFDGGANEVSLRAARENYMLFGAYLGKYKSKVRAPYEDEK